MVWGASIALALAVFGVVALVLGIMRFHERRSCRALGFAWRAFAASFLTVVGLLAMDIVRHLS